MSSEKTQEAETYVLAHRSSAEVERLNWQHNYIRRCMGGQLIHQSIPMDEIANIADVACGTGVLLEDLSKELSASAPATGAERSFIGFDISPKMFPPKSEWGKIKFELLDIMKPIPEDYQAKYDLVSVRLLSVAVKKVDLGLIIRNVEQMIKPGGYLQWVETVSNFLPDVPEYPKVHYAAQNIMKFWTGAGFSPDSLKDLMEKAPPSFSLTKKRYDFPWNGTPELLTDAMKLFTFSFNAMVAISLFRTQEVSSMEEGEKKAQEALEEAKTMPKEKLMAAGKWTVMVAQKQPA